MDTSTPHAEWRYCPIHGVHQDWTAKGTRCERCRRDRLADARTGAGKAETQRPPWRSEVSRSKEPAVATCPEADPTPPPALSPLFGSRPSWEGW